MSRLLDQIIHGNYRIELPSHCSWTREGTRNLIRSVVEPVVAMDAQHIADWCIDHARKDLNELSVPFHLPFHSMWLEARVLAPDDDRIFQMGMLLCEGCDINDVPLNYLLYFNRIDTRTPMLVGGVGLKSNGKDIVNGIKTLEINKKQGLDQEYDDQMWWACWFTLNTLICFDCKQISLRKTECRTKQSENSFRKFGHHLPDFHVIDIHRDHAPALGTPHQQYGDHSVAEAHMVRAHKKIYTQKAPLFGKHVGIFKFKAHPRGQGTPKPATYRVWGPSPEHLPNCKLNQPSEDSKNNCSEE